MNIAKIDRPIKLVLHAAHIFSFAIYYGATVLGRESDTAKLVAIITGLLMALREVIRNKPKWLVRTDGILSVLKLLIILTDDLYLPIKVWMLSVVVLFGAMSSHMPDEIKKKYWIVRST